MHKVRQATWETEDDYKITQAAYELKGLRQRMPLG